MVNKLAVLALLVRQTTLTQGVHMEPSSSGHFEASFSDLEKIGESNYTHFWMPAPLTLSSRLPNALLMAHVDL